MQLSKRTESFTDSVIRRMTRIANDAGAVNLSQGFPDFDPPCEITNRLAEVALTGRISTRLPGEPRTSGTRLPRSMSISPG